MKNKRTKFLIIMIVLLTISFSIDCIVHVMSNSQLDELTDKYNKLQANYAASVVYNNEADSAITSLLDYSSRLDERSQQSLTQIYFRSNFTYHVLNLDKIRKSINNN